MNKPIRRVAFVAMLMFALLLGNGTYSVLFRQAEPGRQRPEPADPRRRVRPGPGRDPGHRQGADGRHQGQRRPVPVPAGLSRRRPVRGGHRLLLLRPRPDRAGEHLQHRSWPAPTTRCSSAAWSTWSPTAHRRARACRPRSCPGCRRRPPRRSATRRARWSRSTPDRRRAGPGDQPDVRPEPDRQPRHRGSEQGLDTGWPRTTTGRWPTGRRARSTRPARPSSWSPPPPPWRTACTGRHQDGVPGPAQAARTPRRTCRTQHQLRRCEDHPHATRCGCPATPPSPTSGSSSGRTSCASRRRSSASTPDTSPISTGWPASSPTTWTRPSSP